VERASLGLDLRELATATLSRPPSYPQSLGQVCLPPLLSGRKTLLEGGILGLSGAIDEKPPEQAGTRPGGRTEPGIAANRANYRAAAGADCRASQCTLLGRGHIGAGSKRPSDAREQQ